MSDQSEENFETEGALDDEGDGENLADGGEVEAVAPVTRRSTRKATRKRRKKSSEVADEPEQPTKRQSKGKKDKLHRRNISAIISEDNLGADAKLAQQREKERLERFKEQARQRQDMEMVRIDCLCHP